MSARGIKRYEVHTFSEGDFPGKLLGHAVAFPNGAFSVLFEGERIPYGFESEEHFLRTFGPVTLIEHTLIPKEGAG